MTYYESQVRIREAELRRAAERRRALLESRRSRRHLAALQDTDDPAGEGTVGRLRGLLRPHAA